MSSPELGYFRYIGSNLLQDQMNILRKRLGSLEQLILLHFKGKSAYTTVL